MTAADIDTRIERQMAAIEAGVEPASSGRGSASRRIRPRPDRAASHPTVIEFAGAVIHDDNGRIAMTWPEGQRAQKDTGRRDSSIRRMREGLRPFIREHGQRRLDSFTRDEAITCRDAPRRAVRAASP